MKIMNVYTATNLAELKAAIENLEQFAWLASKCDKNASAATINAECEGNAGVSLRLIEHTLTDGSKVYDVEFVRLDTRIPQARIADALTKGGRS